MNEHETKYEALAQKLGIEALKWLVPAKPEEIRQALVAGDEHLNTIQLPRWDRAAGVRPAWKLFSSDWPQTELRISARRSDLPWHKEPTLSLAERVCVLKHVAKFHM